MKKNVLKIGAIVAVASAAVWNVGINETKVFQQHLMNKNIWL